MTNATGSPTCRTTPSASTGCGGIACGVPSLFSTGAAQDLGEFTGTGEFKINSMLITRLEARHDISSIRFFNKGTVPSSAYGETTLTLGLMVVLGPYK